MIGYNLLDSPPMPSNYATAYQVQGKVYVTYGFNWVSIGFDFTNYNSHANIIYI